MKNPISTVPLVTTPPSDFCSDELLSERIPLFGAVESGSLERVELLLAHSARLDRVNGYDNDVLDVALTQDRYYGKEYQAPPPVYLTITKRLVEAADARGWTPLHAECP